MTFRRTLHRLCQGVFVFAFLCALAGCLRWQSEALPRPPDRVLFERAMMAVEDERFDVARLTFQTLVNTYPDSEYAERAKEMLRDPQLYGSGSNRDASTCHTSPDSMCFFPAKGD